MEVLHHHRHSQHLVRNFFSKIPSYLKTGAEIIGTTKMLFDVGRSLYSAAQYAAPVVGALAI